MKYLVTITARGGSKGIPGKNIKLLGGKPLICYSIDVARLVTNDIDICVSTEDPKIIKVVEDYGLSVPFVRPVHLATDSASSNDVILHALNYYEQQGRYYDAIVLLQPTSPFRKKEYIQEALKLYSSDIDMVVSVKKASTNPYYNCFEEDRNGFLKHSKIFNKKISRRQDAPNAYEYNGSIYIINPKSLKEKGMRNFSKIVKYEMDDLHSIDLDTMMDWDFAELVLNKYNNLL